MVTQGLAYLDKTATNYANIFGIRTTLHITQAQFVRITHSTRCFHRPDRCSGMVRFRLLHRIFGFRMARKLNAAEVFGEWLSLLKHINLTV